MRLQYVDNDKLVIMTYRLLAQSAESPTVHTLIHSTNGVKTHLNFILMLYHRLFNKCSLLLPK